MAGNTYVTKGYSHYNHIPTPQGGYDHGPQNPIMNKIVAQTKTNKWAHAPASGYTYLSGTPTKFELLREYVYAPNMVSRYEDYRPNYGLNYENSTPNKRLFSPVLGYSTQESKQVHSSRGLAGVTHTGTGNISGPNKSWQSAGPPATHHPLMTSTNKPNYGLNYENSTPNERPLSPALGYSTQESKQVHSSPGLAGVTHTETGNISGASKSWQSADPPATHHPLMTSTNNIDKALGYAEQSVNHSSVLDLRRTRPLEPQSQYERLSFLAKPANSHNSANTKTNY